MDIYFIFSMAYLRSGGRLFDKVLLDAVENCAANFLASLFEILSFLSCQICSYFCEANDARRKNGENCGRREGTTRNFRCRDPSISPQMFSNLQVGKGKNALSTSGPKQEVIRFVQN